MTRLLLVFYLLTALCAVQPVYAKTADERDFEMTHRHAQKADYVSYGGLMVFYGINGRIKGSQPFCHIVSTGKEETMENREKAKAFCKYFSSTLLVKTACPQAEQCAMDIESNTAYRYKIKE